MLGCLRRSTVWVVYLTAALNERNEGNEGNERNEEARERKERKELKERNEPRAGTNRHEGARPCASSVVLLTLLQILPRGELARRGRPARAEDPAMQLSIAGRAVRVVVTVLARTDGHGAPGRGGPAVGDRGQVVVLVVVVLRGGAVVGGLGGGSLGRGGVAGVADDAICSTTRLVSQKTVTERAGRVATYPFRPSRA